MRTLGLIGGMSWESTAVYYRLINEQVRDQLGGLHSARMVLYSVDFAEVEQLQANDQWEQAGELLAGAARALHAAGADGLVLCTNTMHKVASAIERATPLLFLHIADATAEAVQDVGLQRVGLVGTRFTMEQDFYRHRLRDRYGIEVLVPDEPDREPVHRIIYEELCLGQVRPASRERYGQVIDDLVQRGAEGIVLGCTEIGLLVDEALSPVPVFDSTALHARAAVDFALGEV
jgi:aspartate racemase